MSYNDVEIVKRINIFKKYNKKKRNYFFLVNNNTY